MKLVLLLAIIIGIWARSCYRKDEISSIIISDIKIENPTSVSVEVIFDINNKTFQTATKNILIEVYTDQDELIASRLTRVNITANETQKYVRVVENFFRPLRNNETITYAKVTLYHKKI